MTASIKADTPIQFIHVGKCGGGTITRALRAGGFRFEKIHMRMPEAIADGCYLFVTRDPVARFVSAFNWRRHLYLNGTLPREDSKDSLSEILHRAERDFLFNFESASAFGEKLGGDSITKASPISTLMALVGHVPQGFDWYLGRLLDQIEPSQIIGVICTENLSRDFERIFGFIPEQEVHRLNYSSSTPVTKVGRANLARIFLREYDALNKLSLMAQKAEIHMSMHYDSVYGAVPNYWRAPQKSELSNDVL